MSRSTLVLLPSNAAGMGSAPLLAGIATFLVLLGGAGAGAYFYYDSKDADNEVVTLERLNRSGAVAAAAIQARRIEADPRLKFDPAKTSSIRVRSQIHQALFAEVLTTDRVDVIDAFLSRPAIDDEMQRSARSHKEGLKFSDAKKKDTADGYAEFIKAFPGGDNTDQARFLYAKRQAEAVRSAEMHATDNPFEEFVKSYPESKYKEDAALAGERLRASEVFANPTEAACQAYILRYKQGPKAALFRDHLAFLRCQTQKDKAGYADYLKEFPDGVYSDSVRAQMLALELERARNDGGILALQDFAARNPGSPFGVEAQALANETFEQIRKNYTAQAEKQSKSPQLRRIFESLIESAYTKKISRIPCLLEPVIEFKEWNDLSANERAVWDDTIRKDPTATRNGRTFTLTKVPSESVIPRLRDATSQANLATHAKNYTEELTKTVGSVFGRGIIEFENAKGTPAADVPYIRARCVLKNKYSDGQVELLICSSQNNSVLSSPVFTGYLMAVAVEWQYQVHIPGFKAPFELSYSVAASRVSGATYDDVLRATFEDSSRELLSQFGFQKK